jgi:hypothetical protein
VCKKEDPTVAYDTSSELSDEDEATSVLDGYTSDESTSYEDYEEMFRSTDVEDPTSFTVHDACDEGSSSVIAPMHDEDSTYDVDDEEDMVVPRHDDKIEQIPLEVQGLEDDYWSRRSTLCRC